MSSGNTFNAAFFYTSVKYAKVLSQTSISFVAFKMWILVMVEIIYTKIETTKKHIRIEILYKIYDI